MIEMLQTSLTLAEETVEQFLEILEFLVGLATDTIYAQLVVVFLITPLSGALFTYTTHKDSPFIRDICLFVMIAVVPFFLTFYIFEKEWGFDGIMVFDMNLSAIGAAIPIGIGAIVATLPKMFRERKLARRAANDRLAEEIERYRL